MKFRLKNRGMSMGLSRCGGVAAVMMIFFSNLVVGEEFARSIPIKTVRPNQLTLPLVVVPSDQNKAYCVNLQLNWSRVFLAAEDSVSFQFNKAVDETSAQNLRDNLSIAGLATAMVWQQPWLSAQWKVDEVPLIDGPAVGSALGVGMIAAASKLNYPYDTVIIGSLNPDGTIGAVSDILARVDAVAAGGFKRVVIPAQQRMEMSSEGKIVDVEGRARSLGLECMVVDDLRETVERVLKTGMPPSSTLSALPRVEGPLFSFLDASCRKELSRLQLGSVSWPRLPDKLKKLKPPQQALWQEILRDYDLALDDYQAGKLYVAWIEFNKLNAKLAAVKEWDSLKPDFDYKSYDDKANDLCQKISNLILEPSFDQNELQSALILAEQADRLYAISARLKGAQALTHQAFGSRSFADKQQMDVAKTLLVNAVATAQYQLEDADFYSRLFRALGSESRPPIASRPSLWLPQLTLAQLAEAEWLNVGLKENANRLREDLLFDPRLTAQAGVLHEAKIAMEKRRQERIQQALKDQPKSNVVKIGFVPGPVYAPPKPPPPPVSPRKLSDTVRCFLGVNDYCEVAVLEQKYLRLEGTFDPSARDWKIPDRNALQSMLQSAEFGARRGMAFAQKAEIDTSVLSLIYENADRLRTSDNDEQRLEALRQYWRCALLGNLCWQFRSPEEVEPVREFRVPPPVPFSAAQIPATKEDQVKDLGQHEGQPVVEAIPVTPEELEEDMDER